MITPQPDSLTRSVDPAQNWLNKMCSKVLCNIYITTMNV